MSAYLTRRGFLLVSVSALSACASNKFQKPVLAATGLSLKGARLQIYSFLDLRDAEFGPNMLLEFDRQVVAALAASDVSAKVLRFKDTEQGKYFHTSNSGMQVPVKQVIEGNAAAEQAFSASHRLIIFPSRMTLAGAWKHYEVRWELFDVKSSERVWAAISNGKHANAWKNDEDPQPRAKTIVDGLTAALKESNLV